MFLKPFSILMNVMIITVAISTFMCRVECVPISNGETVPDDGESKTVWLCVHREREKNAISQSISNLFLEKWHEKKRRGKKNQQEPYMISISDVTFSFAVSIQYREFNKSSKLYQYKHFCGGVLLQVYNRTAYVISASHCMGNVYVYHLN